MNITITSSALINPISVSIAGVGTAGTGSGLPQVQTDWNATTGLGVLLNKPTTVSAFTNDLGYLSSVTWSIISGKPTFSAVATSGNYSDLLNKPTIPTVPTNISAFTNDAGYLSSVSWTSVTGKPTFAAVATSGNYSDLIGTPNLSNMTNQGNTFNGALQLVQLDAGGKLPAVDGSLLTGIASGGGQFLNITSNNFYFAWDYPTKNANWYASCSSGYIYMTPFTVKKTITAKALGFYNATATAGTSLIGIYDSSDIGLYPKNLLTSGSISVSATAGYNTVTLGSIITLQPGTVYWSAVRNDISRSIDGISNNYACSPIQKLLGMSTVSNYALALSSSTLPIDISTSRGSFVNSGSAPNIFLTAN